MGHILKLDKGECKQLKHKQLTFSFGALKCVFSFFKWYISLSIAERMGGGVYKVHINLTLDKQKNCIKMLNC